MCVYACVSARVRVCVRARVRVCVWMKSVLIFDDGCVAIMAADKSVLLMTVRLYR